MLPRRLRLGCERLSPAPPDVWLTAPPSSASSDSALCLLPSIWAGGTDGGDIVVTREPEPEPGGGKALGAEDGGFEGCSGGSCVGGMAGWVGASVGGEDGSSAAGGIWIEAWRGGWPATAPEFGVCGNGERSRRRQLCRRRRTVWLGRIPSSGASAESMMALGHQGLDVGKAVVPKSWRPIVGSRRGKTQGRLQIRAWRCRHHGVLLVQLGCLVWTCAEPLLLRH